VCFGTGRVSAARPSHGRSLGILTSCITVMRDRKFVRFMTAGFEPVLPIKC
jgi:hypothetical protein